MVIEPPDSGIFANACAATSFVSTGWPLDVYIMLDRSSSMFNAIPGGHRWNWVRDALAEFLQKPSTAGMRVGLQYFPLENACATFLYANPAVEIGELPKNTSMLIQSLETTEPTGNTPMSEALRGAISHAKNWALQNPERTVVVLLATDGLPTECNQNVSYLAGTAANGFDFAPHIKTFVVGVGDNLAPLHAIAAGGGTTKAKLLEGTTVTNELLDAMADIATEAVECRYPVPTSSKSLGYGMTVVEVKPQQGKSQMISKIPDDAGCPVTGGGWYYEYETQNSMKPDFVVLCPESCAKLMSDGDAKVNIAIPCAAN